MTARRFTHSYGDDCQPPQRAGGCQCDPPGAGEEFCTGHCVLRAAVDEKQRIINTLVLDNARLRAELQGCQPVITAARLALEQFDRDTRAILGLMPGDADNASRAQLRRALQALDRAASPEPSAP